MHNETTPQSTARDAGQRKLAIYTVRFERELGDEDGQNYLGVTDEESAIQQLRKELQDAYDECGIAGNFNILSREVVPI